MSGCGYIRERGYVSWSGSIVASKAIHRRCARESVCVSESEYTVLEVANKTIWGSGGSGVSVEQLPAQVLLNHRWW